MKISIVTATWNRADTIRSTIESVLSQTHGDWEHIIVDGASTDNTLEIIEEYRGRYRNRLKLVSEPDRGIYDAMNKGIALAEGDVVGILNSDDFYSADDILATVNDRIEGVDAVYGDVHYVNDSDLCKCVRRYSSKGFRPWAMRMGFQPAHPSFYCRRSVYDRFGKFDLDFKVAADFENLLRLIHVNRISTRYVDRDFVTMRTGGASTAGLQSHKRILRDHLLAYRKNNVRSGIIPESFRYFCRIVSISMQKAGL